MPPVMDNGIQAVSARIAQLEQRFVDGAASGTESSSDTSAASGFASVLAAALGTNAANTAALGLDAGTGGSQLGTPALGQSALGQSALGQSALGTSGLGLGSSALNTNQQLGANQQLTASMLIGLLSAVARGGALAATATGSGDGVANGSGATTPVGANGLRPATKLAPGAYPKLTPPAELVGYGNGRIPAERLESIGVGSHKLYAPAAQSYRHMTADAAAQGVKIGITDSYRSYDSQVDLAGRKGLYSQGGLAASPGTSNHGWGLAVDLDLDATAQQWMRDNGARYGFVEDTPREPWHWGYRPASSV